MNNSFNDIFPNHIRRLEASNGTGGGVKYNFVPVARKTSLLAYGLSNGDANHQAVTYKVRHYAIRKCSMIKLVYTNTQVNSDGVNDITIGASIENSSGKIIVATFNGQINVTIKPGGFITSDPIVMSFNKGEVFYTRNYVSVTTLGEKWPVGMDHENSTPEGMGQGDMTTSGSVTTTVHEKYFHPITILGIPDISENNRDVSVLFLGDSITAGNTSDTNNSYTGNGFSQLAGVTWGIGTLTAGCPGSSTPASFTEMQQRMQLAIYGNATHAVTLFGANDLMSTLYSFSQIQQRYINLWTWLASMGMKVYQGTILPRTSSDLATPAHANFNPGSGSLRGQINAWIRTVPSPLSGYFETADAVETGRDTGVWKTGYSDGVHPFLMGYTAMANACNLSTLN